MLCASDLFCQLSSLNFLIQHVHEFVAFASLNFADEHDEVEVVKNTCRPLYAVISTQCFIVFSLGRYYVFCWAKILSFCRFLTLCRYFRTP